MKRITVFLVLLAIYVSASAQYNPSANLYKKGGGLYMNGEKLSKEQLQLVLSPFSNEKGISYDELWHRAGAMRTSGIVLTSVGSVASIAGPFLSIIGIAKILGSGIGSAISGDPDGVVGEEETIAGVVLTGAGVAMLGSGIPLLCVGNSRMKKIVRDCNSRPSPPDLSVSLCPAPGGFGIALRF